VVQDYVANLGSIGYLETFIAGMLFSFGFSTPFAIGFFLIAKPENIFLAALIGGAGALISDLLIFKLIRFSFMDEFKRLEKTTAIKEINHLLNSRWIYKIKIYLLYIFAGLVIASPLPDELGVSMLAGLTKIKTHILVIVSFIMNSLGIFIMLLIAR
jgi:hypothetical protein